MEKSSGLCQKFPTGLSKLLATFPEEHSGDKFIFWETLFSFESSRTLKEKFSPIWQNNFGLLCILFRQDCKNWLLLVLESNLKQSFFLEKKYSLLVLGHWLKKLWASVEHFWTWFSKLISTWTEVHFEFGRDLREKYFFFVTFGFWSKSFWLDFQTCIPRVQRNTFRILPFFEKLASFSHFHRQRRKV